MKNKSEVMASWDPGQANSLEGRHNMIMHGANMCVCIWGKSGLGVAIGLGWRRSPKWRGMLGQQGTTVRTRTTATQPGLSPCLAKCVSCASTCHTDRSLCLCAFLFKEIHLTVPNNSISFLVW